MTRVVTVLIALLLAATDLHAADDVPAKIEATAGTCFTYQISDQTSLVQDPASAFATRIDLQALQYKVENKPLPETRFRIGVLIKGDSGSVENDISAPCTGEKLTFNCTMRCADKVIGKFRAEALPTRPTEPKADYLKLVIEAPTTINGCSQGKTPFNLPNGLVGLQIILKGAEPKTCFR